MSGEEFFKKLIVFIRGVIFSDDKMDFLTRGTAELIVDFEKEIRHDQKNRCINAIMNGQDIIRTHGLKRSSITKTIMETD